MAKTCGGHNSNYRPHLRPSSPAPAVAPPPVASPAAAATVGPVVAPDPVNLVQHRYETIVGPTPPSPPHLQPSKRPPPPKRARTSGPEESSNLRPQEHPLLPPQSSISDIPQDETPGSIIPRLIFYCGPIPGNSDYCGKDMHNELRDSMRLVQRYSLKPFMTPCQFLYPRVLIEFYQTMTSSRDPNPTTMHLSIDGREGILRATDLTATINLSIILANSTKHRQWPHPSPRDMVRILARDTSTRPMMFRR